MMERQVRRRRIQEVARNVIATNGFAGSSIERIAKAAQMSVGAIYLHFRSKDDLCVSLFEEALALVVSCMVEGADGSEPHGRLQASWTRLVDWARVGDNAAFLRLLALPRTRSQLSDDVVGAVAVGTDRVKQHLADCVQRGIDGGLYRRVDTAEVAETLWALLLGCLDATDIDDGIGRTSRALDERAHRGFLLLEQGLLARCPQ